MRELKQLACHFDYGNQGSVVVIDINSRPFGIQKFKQAPPSNLSLDRKPIYLHAEANHLIYFDPVEKTIRSDSTLAQDARAGYAYFDGTHKTAWIMNDGDKEKGADPLNCGEKGSSVSVFNAAGATPNLHKTVCVGKGHHVTTFTYPTDAQQDIPHRAFVSNLLEGSLSIVDNDPASKQYLEVLDRINLADPERDPEKADGVPNNAFPHGMVFSPRMGLIYSLNNGYGTVCVIDPRRNEIIDKLTLKSSSNILLSPDGRYLIGKGADRKSNPEHIIGKLSVLDLESKEIVSTLDMPDVYPSTYKFNAEGTALYLTTAMTGKGQQRDNVITDELYVFDSQFPELTLKHTLKVGKADCGRRPIAFYEENGSTQWVFNPNLTDGTLDVIDGQTQESVETLNIADGDAKEVTFSFWPNGWFGT